MADNQALIDSLKRDWSSEDYYNFEDLNRVEEATIVVRDKISEWRGVLVQLTTVLDRGESHIEFADSLNRIEDNIFKLMETYPNPSIFQEPKRDWVFNTPFDSGDANRLEQNLYDMYYAVVNNISNIPYCGQIVAGQQGVI